MDDRPQQGATASPAEDTSGAKPVLLIRKLRLVLDQFAPERPALTLRQIGHPNADDHEALIALRSAMLKVVEDAILAVTELRKPANQEDSA